jgi:hypothetical protein
MATLEQLAQALQTGSPGQVLGIAAGQTIEPITPSGSGPSPSSSTPASIGAPAVGVSLDYARADHAHGGALADLSDVASTAPTSGQVLAWGGSEWAPATASGGGPSPSDANPANISPTPSPGTSPDYSRADHEHRADVVDLADRFERLPLQNRAEFAAAGERDIQEAIDAHTSGDAAVILAAPGSYPGATVVIGTGKNNLAVQGLGATSLGGTITSLSGGRGLSITGTAQRARVIGLQIEGLTTIDSSAPAAIHRFENCQLVGGLTIATPSSAGIVLIYMIGCEFAGPITLTPGTAARLIIDRGIFGASVTFTNVSAARINIANSAGIAGTATTYQLNGLISNSLGINTLYVNNTAVTVP